MTVLEGEKSFDKQTTLVVSAAISELCNSRPIAPVLFIQFQNHSSFTRSKPTAFNIRFCRISVFKVTLPRRFRSNICGNHWPPRLSTQIDIFIKKIFLNGFIQFSQFIDRPSIICKFPFSKRAFLNLFIFLFLSTLDNLIINDIIF